MAIFAIAGFVVIICLGLYSIKLAFTSDSGGRFWDVILIIFIFAMAYIWYAFWKSNI
ncbi:MAG: hypothetical protein JHD34_05100 [Candidatus Nanopelagicus sp.]|jgi:hypothetical protein|nr:hypothetical protein [Candidatus Nanopelagicus sp.]